VIGNSPLLRALQPQQFVDGSVGLPTITDILKELEKPGRDPRPAFTTATFAEGVEKISHLKPGMVLEGVVTNVAAFGAFVDVGVHQDGLVHVSALSNKFVKDPREVVKSGDVVKVRVVEVDEARKRISLTMRLEDDAREQRRGERRGDAAAGGGERRGAPAAGSGDRPRQSTGPGSQRRAGGDGAGAAAGTAGAGAPRTGAEQRADRQRSEGQRSGGQRADGQRSGGQRSGGQRSDGQRSGGQPAGGAMADALRRAGLIDKS
jgi:uncharacterized protein